MFCGYQSLTMTFFTWRLSFASRLDYVLHPVRKLLFWGMVWKETPQMAVLRFCLEIWQVSNNAHPTAFLKALYNLRRFSYKSITPNLLYQLHSTQPSKSKVIPLYYINIYFNHLPSEFHLSQTIQDSPNRAWIRHRHLGTPEGAGGWPRRLASRPPQPPQRSQFEVHGGAGAQRAAARAEKPWVEGWVGGFIPHFSISQVFHMFQSFIPRFPGVSL